MIGPVHASFAPLAAAIRARVLRQPLGGEWSGKVEVSAMLAPGAAADLLESVEPLASALGMRLAGVDLQRSGEAWAARMVLLRKPGPRPEPTCRRCLDNGVLPGRDHELFFCRCERGQVCLAQYVVNGRHEGSEK